MRNIVIFGMWVIISFLAFVLIVDWPQLFSLQLSSTSNNKSIQHYTLTKKSEKFLLIQYDTAITEIQNRIEEEHILFTLKFTLVGAVLALLFTQPLRSNYQGSLRSLNTSPMAACFFWAAVITSGIVDCRILFNADFISTLGKWIKNNVEPFFYQNPQIGWEHYLSNKAKLINSSLYPLLRLNNHLLTFFLFFITMLLFALARTTTSQSRDNLDEPHTNNDELRFINCFGSSTSFIVFGFAAIHYHYDNLYWPYICFFLVVLGIILSCFIFFNEVRRE